MLCMVADWKPWGGFLQFLDLAFSKHMYMKFGITYMKFGIMCPTYPARVALLYGSLAVLCSILSNTCRQEIAAAAREQLSSGASTNTVVVR